MEVFPDLSALDDAELRALVERKLEDERAVSYRRRVLQGQIDLLRAERATRLKELHGQGTAVDEVGSEQLGDAMARGAGGRPSGATWAPQGPEVLEAFPDLSTVDDAELRALIDERSAEEQDLSYDRRMLHGHIDMLHAEVIARIHTRKGEPASDLAAIDVTQLSEILAHHGPPDGLATELEELG